MINLNTLYSPEDVMVLDEIEALRRNNEAFRAESGPDLNPEHESEHQRKITSLQKLYMALSGQNEVKPDVSEDDIYPVAA